MPLTINRLIPPLAEPVTLAQAKLHLRVDIDDDDDLIDALITSAREMCEDYTERAFAASTWELCLDCWPSGPIYLPRSPALKVLSITYIDTAGTVQTLDATLYTVDLKSIRPRIVPAYNQRWPAHRSQINAITVTFMAGYARLAEVSDESVGTSAAAAAQDFQLASIPATAGSVVVGIAQGTGIVLEDDGDGAMTMTDDGGTGLTLVSGTIDTDTGAGHLVFSAPLTADKSITADYQGMVADVPKRAVQAMLMLIGGWYENREAVITDNRIATDEVPMGARYLLEGLNVATVH